MNRIKEQERVIRENRAYKALPSPKPPITAQVSARPAKKPMASARELCQPIPDDLVEMKCDTCGGNGWDPGSLDPFGELCPDCKGSKVEYVSLKKLMDQGIVMPEKAKEVA